MEKPTQLAGKPARARTVIIAISTPTKRTSQTMKKVSHPARFERPPMRAIVV